MGTDTEREIARLNEAVDAFAIEMKARLEAKARQGYTGWDTRDPAVRETIMDALVADVIYLNEGQLEGVRIVGHEVDIANRAMMIYFKGRYSDADASSQPQESDPLPTVPCITCATPLLPYALHFWDGKGPYCSEHYIQAQTDFVRSTARRDKGAQA